MRLRIVLPKVNPRPSLCQRDVPTLAVSVERFICGRQWQNRCEIPCIRRCRCIASSVCGANGPFGSILKERQLPRRAVLANWDIRSEKSSLRAISWSHSACGREAAQFESESMHVFQTLIPFSAQRRMLCSLFSFLSGNE